MPPTLLPVQVTAEDGRTTTVHVELTTVEVRREPEPFTGSRHGLYAMVRVGNEPDQAHGDFIVYTASRLVGEGDWTVDSTFLANGFQQHANGFGARCSEVRKLDAAIAALLDREAVRLQIATTTDAGSPLALPCCG
ncbi:hypothetical protein ACFC58_06305 [Kitasatospora purpeofusca]|uniref:hypothetical protein n=1 Tax=Kitasatospora purpeofusca TaxID=67352 RepID=UPI0035E1B5FB